jgi:DNA helicase-2/ATP-dependent DNA helicase PcrA
MFARFRTDFADATIIALTSNYRSRPQIVTLANAVFPATPQLTAQTDEPGVVRALQTLNEYSEAAYVLHAIEQGIGGSDLLKANGDHHVREPREYAVLYRTHRAALTLQKAFADAGLPYQVVGEGSPYERPEIQAIITLLQYVYQQDGSTKQAVIGLPLLRRTSLLQRNALLVKCLTIDTNQSVCDMVHTITSLLTLSSGDNLQQLSSTLAQFGDGRDELGRALAYLEDISRDEFYDSTVNAVTLMTIHASKGLEFGHVFLIAAEEGTLPKLTNSEPEEEQRLFYVAATRAKDSLEILHAKVRGGKSVVPSRFITELSQTILPHSADPALPALEKRLKRRAAERAQGTLF